MKSNLLFTMELAKQILNTPAFRLIHLCELGCVRPTQDARGRGTSRRFDKDDLFMLAASLELQNAAVSPPRIAKINRIFDWLCHMRLLKPAFQDGGLCGVISSLGNTDDPVMLHVKIQERAVKIPELPMAFIQSKIKLPVPPESGYGTCMSVKPLDIWPAKISLNLTFILSSIRLR